MPNQVEMRKVLDALKNYLKSVEEFQSGEKTKVESDSLDKLERDMQSDDGDKKISDVDPEHKSESFENLITSIQAVEFVEDVVPYTKLTRLIYKEAQDKREMLDMLDDTMMTDWDNYQKSKIDISSETTRKFLKIKEHIGLSAFQRNHISDKLTEQLEETQKKLKKTDESFSDLSKSLDLVEQKAHEKADKLVVQFITILGIFAAIMMGAIGSFQSFTSIFSNAENIPIGKTLIISAAGASGVSLILFLLLHAISKLTTFKLTNCDCDKTMPGTFTSISETMRLSIFGGKPEPKCTCSMFNKYPTIFIVNYLFYYIAFTGFVFMYLNFYNYFEMNRWKHTVVIGVFYLIATILLIFVHRYLIDKKVKEKSFYKFIADIKKTPSYFKDAFKS